MRHNFLIVALFLSSFSVQADSTHDQAIVNDAVVEVSKQLQDPNARQKLINQNAESKKAHSQAIEVVGEQNQDEIYAISADILPLLFKEAGNPEQASLMLQQASANPKEFFDRLPAETKEKIRKLSAKVKPSAP